MNSRVDPSKHIDNNTKVLLIFGILIAILCVVFIPDNYKTTMIPEGLSPYDPSSFSRPDLAKVTNIHIILTVDFSKKTFRGSVELTVEKIDENVKEVILDAKHLHITSIYETKLNVPVKFSISDVIGEFGSKLSIELPPKETTTYVFKITYETSPDASGLQWLDPVQTAGKQYPFVFSQFQAIHARSVIPCQDTPAVKTKYSAVITVPSELTVVMSAIRKHQKSLHGAMLNHFVQDVPVPAYLIAIAIGALESKEIGPRSHVWAEKELLEASAFEFANTEHQLKTAEDICGPYVWGTYDLLVLPPSFPFGGMENPCLTFVTPTLLAGDRSLANVVAHEIAHSWTGNLVTNRNFEHFWLNEGFTVFLERRILARLVSAQEQDFQAYCGTEELKETIQELGKNNALTKLVVDLKDGVHPDDSFSKVPYEKGQTFVRYLENVVGGSDVFEKFLRQYFDNFKYQSIDTNDFKNFFESYFNKTEAIKNIDWNTWLYSPGMPPLIPKYDTSLVEVCESFKDRWMKWNENDANVPIDFTDDVKSLSSSQIILFLQQIISEEKHSVIKLKALEQLFNLNSVQNAEIKFRWFRLCLKAHWEEKVEQILKWLNQVGRMKYVRPLYRDLYAWEEIRPKAIENFKINRKNMMHVTAYTVAKDLRFND